MLEPKRGAVMRAEWSELIDNLFFSKEAAEYLGISSQRLNQLVHSGVLTPVKRSPSGSLFFKEHLDERAKAVKNIGKVLAKDESAGTIDMNTPFMNEVLNYYVIQRFHNYSDKKTEPVFAGLSRDIDMSQEFKYVSAEIAKRFGLSQQALGTAYDVVRRAFMRLSTDDLIIKKGTAAYPRLLGMTQEAPPYLFLRGNISLLNEPIVSVVGSRKASNEGLLKAKKLAQLLGREGIVVASGLARGIDTAAHTSSLENGFLTIAVIGTSITEVYPKENERLQREISEKGLVVSQFPPSTPTQRWHFPMRNAVMSGISLATVIVEASETSGALRQADYALKQQRLVFIPQSALTNPNITWPRRYIEQRGAKKFATIGELLRGLQEAEIIPSDSEQLRLFSKGADWVDDQLLK